MPKARILIVDNHPLVRDGLKLLIHRQTDLSCCGQAGTVAEARSLVEKNKPDLVILDIGLEGGDGLELIQILTAQSPGLRILIFSEYSERLYVERVLRAGGLGYLSKAHTAEEVLNAIRSVLAGEACLARGMAALFLRRFVRAGELAAPSGARPLTDGELRVFQLLGAGRSTREIAADLNRSFKTVESHRENIKRKLQLKGAAELINRAIHWARVSISLSCPVEVRTPETLF